MNDTIDDLLDDGLILRIDIPDNNSLTSSYVLECYKGIDYLEEADIYIGVPNWIKDTPMYWVK